jgi:transcriptional regulator with XRE-family HTH domain
LDGHNVSYSLQNVVVLYIIIYVMTKGSHSFVPRVRRLLAGFGDHLKLARLRRRYSAETVAQRAGITRPTLSKIEQGDPSVSLGAYVRVMQALRLEGDIEKLAADDELGRKLQDAEITPKLRAPKRSSVAGDTQADKGHA